MRLGNYSQEELEEISMIVLATMILEKKKKAVAYQDLYQQIAEIKKFTAKEKDEYIAQFYTDLNTDGRFLTLGSGLWGLKTWYPVEQIDEQLNLVPKKKKKKAAAKKPKKKTKKQKELEAEEDITETPLDFVQTDFVEEDIEDDDDLEDDLDEDILDDDFDTDDDDDDDEKEDNEKEDEDEK